MHLKLDELIRAVAAARTSMVDLEELSDAELERLRHEFRDLRQHLEVQEAKFGAEANRRAGGRRMEDRFRE
jgi:low affinity Fe/Cu permease